MTSPVASVTESRETLSHTHFGLIVIEASLPVRSFVFVPLGFRDLYVLTLFANLKYRIKQEDVFLRYHLLPPLKVFFSILDL